MVVNSKCKNCLNFHEGAPPSAVTYEFHIWCKKHYGRFWDVFLDESNVCPFYDPYQYELKLESNDD